jgi:hypothetical protein
MFNIDRGSIHLQPQSATESESQPPAAAARTPHQHRAAATPNQPTDRTDNDTDAVTLPATTAATFGDARTSRLDLLDQGGGGSSRGGDIGVRSIFASDDQPDSTFVSVSAPKTSFVATLPSRLADSTPISGGGFTDRTRGLLAVAGIASVASVQSAGGWVRDVASAATNVDRAVDAAAATTTGAVFTLATPAMSSARYFGFSPLSLPYTLAADSVAAFAEESAVLSAAVANRARPSTAITSAPAPWTFTAAVLALDLIVITYIHRRPRAKREESGDEFDWEICPAAV